MTRHDDRPGPLWWVFGALALAPLAAGIGVLAWAATTHNLYRQGGLPRETAAHALDVATQWGPGLLFAAPFVAALPWLIWGGLNRRHQKKQKEGGQP